MLDTGPLVAYLDAGDVSHEKVAARLDDFRGLLVTTSAVITEAMFLLGVSREGPWALAEFIAASGAEIYDLCRPPELNEAAGLMERCGDTPMDFADATLVLLGEALGVYRILTLDRRGFSTYRTRQGRAFELVLDAR